MNIEYTISPININRTMEETNTNCRSCSTAKPKTAIITRRIGVSINSTSPRYINVTGSNEKEYIFTANSSNDGFEGRAIAVDGKKAAISNPKIKRLALIKTPRRSARLVHLSTLYRALFNA